MTTQTQEPRQTGEPIQVDPMPVSPARDADLFLDGVLVDLRIGWWRGKVPLTPEDVGISPDTVPDIFQLGRKLIIPANALSDFERAYNRAHYAVKQFTFPFPTGNARFVPYSVLPEVMQYIQQSEQDFKRGLAKFLSNYDDYRTQMIEDYPDHEKALQKAEIKVLELEKHFHFKYSVYEVVLPKNVRFEAVEAADAVIDAKAKREAAIKAETAYREQFDAQLDEFLAESVGSLRSAVADAVMNIGDRLESGDGITKGSIDSLKRTIERFKKLNFVGDMDVEAKLDELTKMIPDSTKDFSDNDIKVGFQKGIEQVMTTLMESDITGTTGEYKRKVRI